MIELLDNIITTLTNSWWGGLLLILIGALTIRSAIQMKKSPDLVNVLRGYVGGIALIIVGFLIIGYQIYKLLI